ncbi:hypothetical protein CCP4SC76_3680007 [Gammaproteobacteria bacterium]
MNQTRHKTYRYMPVEWQPPKLAPHIIISKQAVQMDRSVRDYAAKIGAPINLCHGIINTAKDRVLRGECRWRVYNSACMALDDIADRNGVRSAEGILNVVNKGFLERNRFKLKSDE